MHAIFHRNIRRRGRGVAVAALLALLLVGMQLESQRHAIGHVGEWMHPAPDTGLQLPVGQDACATCALFAAGADTAHADTAASNALAAEFAVPREPVATNATPASPSPYHSRAPPSLL